VTLEEIVARLETRLNRLVDLQENTPRLNTKDVLRRYGWSSRSTIYRKQKREGFPQAKRHLWRPGDLDAWDADPRPGQPLQSVRRPARK